MPMKKGRTRRTGPDKADELSPEYQFDYRQAKPNRFAAQAGAPCRVVALDTDVAQVFTTPEAVNRVLRALISTMPQTVRRNSR
ncbi:MAG: hypothetical protein ACT4QC_10455 [Planctomycetaceae bacterium]